MEAKYLLSEVTIKTLGDKFKFKSKFRRTLIINLVLVLNKTLLNKLAEKLPEETLEMVRFTLTEVINDLPEIKV